MAAIEDDIVVLVAQASDLIRLVRTEKIVEVHLPNDPAAGKDLDIVVEVILSSRLLGSADTADKPERSIDGEGGPSDHPPDLLNNVEIGLTETELDIDSLAEEPGSQRVTRESGLLGSLHHNFAENTGKGLDLLRRHLLHRLPGLGSNLVLPGSGLLDIFFHNGISFRLPITR